MSIEKIKNRIMMIENNDFTIKEVISGSNSDLETLFTKADDSAVKAVARADYSADKTNDLYNKWLDGEKIDNDDPINKNAKPEDIPKKDRSIVFGIYKEMEVRNILPNDLQKGTFKPKHGYFRSQTGVKLILFKEKLISILYSDAKLKNIKSMNILIGNNVKNNDFVDFYDELKTNKTKYSIRKITMVNKGTGISIKF
jgi:hypothetical protein